MNSAAHYATRCAPWAYLSFVSISEGAAATGYSALGMVLIALTILWEDDRNKRKKDHPND